MRINGIDIETFEARQLRVTIGHMETTNASAWAAGSAVPYFAKNRYGFKHLTITLMVKGDGREDIKKNCSGILALITGRTELVLDGFDTYFVGALSATPTREERSRQIWHNLTLEFNAYEYMTPVEYTGTSSVSVYNPGTVDSPAIVTLTPSVRINPVHLTGLCRDSNLGTDLPVTIEELLQDTPVTIDGITGLITEDGDPKDIEMWTLPSFKPGTTAVTCDSSYVTIKVKVYPIVG